MYNRNNPTAINSREWLIELLISLMGEMPYSKITVKEICNRADLSRQTFYNFFNTKDEIICFCIKRCHKEMMESLNNMSSPEISDVTDSLIYVFQTHHVFIKLILSHHLDDILIHVLIDSISAFTEQLNPDTSGYPEKYSTAFLSGAISQIIICWFKDPNPLSSEDLSKLLTAILTGQYYKL